MKLGLLLSLLLATPSAFGFCPSGWLDGESESGTLSVSYDGNCGADGEPKLYIYWRIDNKERSSALFNQECKEITNKSGSVESFSCRIAGITPLAGATYKIIRTGVGDECGNGDTSDIYIFSCISGCGAEAPKVLKVDPICD
jgi:hypothetical protein